LQYKITANLRPIH